MTDAPDSDLKTTVPNRERTTHPACSPGSRTPPSPGGSIARTVATCRDVHAARVLGRTTIAPDKSVSWAYGEDFLPSDDALLRAADRAAQLGVPAVSPGQGAVLRLVAAALRASAVVEVGTGTGVSGLWLLRGMVPEGVLTTIDTEAEHQRAAKQTFAEAGVRSTRVRTITGRALDVLPRLTDGAYDLVLLDGDPLEAHATVEHALRLLRPGGVVALAHALHEDRVPDPARRDEVTTALREVARLLRDDERVVPAMLPTGDGLLLAART